MTPGQPNAHRSKDTPEDLFKRILVKAKNSSLVNFITAYPRIASVIAIILLIVIIALPLSWRDKLLLPLRALVIGLLMAVGIYFLRMCSHCNNRKGS